MLAAFYAVGADVPVNLVKEWFHRVFINGINPLFAVLPDRHEMAEQQVLQAVRNRRLLELKHGCNCGHTLRAVLVEELEDTDTLFVAERHEEVIK